LFGFCRGGASYWLVGLGIDGVGRLVMYMGVEGREIWICVGERGRKGKGLSG
jgi:hypothetical protein